MNQCIAMKLVLVALVASRMLSHPLGVFPSTW